MMVTINLKFKSEDIARFSWIIVLLLYTSLATAQGIEFETSLSWQKIREKAKQENKYILVDCSTTWCVPCRKLEQEVFALKEVGNLVNGKLVAAKFQMDQTDKDSEITKARYADAKMLAAKYMIRSYPTLLFFSPDGMLVNKTGYQTAEQLIATLNVVTDSTQNLLGKMKAFEEGRLDAAEMGELARSLMRAGENSKASAIAQQYKDKYLDKLPIDSLFNREFIDFVLDYSELLNSTDKFFCMFRERGSEVDTLMHLPTLSASAFDFVVKKEEIDSWILPKIKDKAFEPQWVSYEKAIDRKYGKAVMKRIILRSKSYWYLIREEWSMASKALLEEIEVLGMPTAPLKQNAVNSNIYKAVFQNSSDKKELERGAKIMEQLVHINPNRFHYIDTYASLLYKMGDIENAIEWEEKAFKIANEMKATDNAAFYKDLILKMEKGEIIW